jgi:predicted permease
MGWMQRLFRRERLEQELDKELAYHVERRIADLVAGGLDDREAAHRVRLEFGGTDEVKEACRDARGTRWVQDFFQDCRYGLRLLRRSPVFTSVAILSLALGIGANTAIFSLMDRILLRMMPVPKPDRLVELVRFWSGRRTNHAYPHFQQLREALQSFEALMAHSWLGEHEISIDGETEIAQVEMASGAYYSMLGVEARIGRTFTEEVDRVPRANPVAVISEAYWERRFGSAPSVVGKTFRRRGTVFTIIGVTPREFTGVTLGKIADITFPVSMAAEVRGGRESWLQDSGTHWLNVMGRLKAGISVSQARSEVAAVFARIAAAEATASQDERRKTAILSQRMELQPAVDGFNELRRDFAKPLAILMGTVALVLLLACANLANLLLARSAARQREIAVRLALGAGRWRVVRQMLAEALPLSFAGGAAGVLLAYGIASGLVTMMANGGPAIALKTHPDGRILGFALLVSVASCVLFSFAPAWQATRQALQPTLAEIRAGRWRLGKGLVVWQMAISVLLLIGAGLFGRTLLNIYSEPAGFRAEDIVLFSTNAPRLGYSIEQMAGLPAPIVAGLKTLSGVRSVSVSGFPPVSGGSGWNSALDVQGYTHSPKEDNVSHANSVGPDFFRTYGTPVLLGREFDPRDTEHAPKVAIVNEAFVRYYFKDTMALGKWISFTQFRREDRFTIVGVVKDVKYEELRQNAPRAVYFSN